MSDDYDLPERLWATVAGIQPQGRTHGIWDEAPSRSTLSNWQEYVRADTGSFYQEKDIDAMQARIAALEAERDRLRSVLATYACRCPYNAPPPDCAGGDWTDCGRRARAALEGGGDG